MAYSGVYVFGDSLVDAGNALKLAQWYSDLTFSDLPDGAPTADLGYVGGRFTDGHTFADLLSNKAVGSVTRPVFPYGFEDPWIGLPIAPFAGDPGGSSLNFAYGGAQVRQGDEVVQDLDSQTDTFRNAVDGDAPPGALYIVTMGGNDVRSLAKAGSLPAPEEDAHDALDSVAQQLIHELGQLIDDGARNFLITGVPDVGLIPKYAGDDGMFDPIELAGSLAATAYSQYLDLLIRTEVVPALEAMGATVTYVPMMDYQDGAATVTGGLNAVLPTLEALHGLDPGTLTTDLLAHSELVFFDDVHPTAQVHALFGSYAQALLTGTEWVETLPLTGADVDYSLTANIAVAGEVDKLVIATVAGTDYRLDLLGISALGTAGSLADPALRLTGPSGGVIGGDADSGAGFDATLTFTAPTSGNYTAELSGTGALTGSYVLQAAVIGGAAMQAGNSYAVSSAAAIVLEGAGGVGVDTVKASTSYTLAIGSEIEVLTTSNAKGKTAINLIGNEFDQAITGNAGANILNGRGGADTLTGGAGKDVFVLGTGGIDAIKDYGHGDVVDLSQMLSVAAGTNVASGGFARVTTSGLVQVDADGGGDGWVTLGTINNGGAVTIRYVSGGATASASLSRVTASTTTMAVAGAVAAAGMESLMADGGPGGDGGGAFHGGTYAFAAAGVTAQPLDGAGTEFGGWAGARLGTQVFAVDAVAAARPGAGDGMTAEGPALDSTQMTMLSALAIGTELPAFADHGRGFATTVATTVATPIAAQSVLAGEGEVAVILAEALGGPGHDLATLLDALPLAGEAPAAMDAGPLHLAAWGAGMVDFAAMGPLAPAMEAIAMHQDTVATV